ncbi:MAG TPA: PIG-L family deacetylase [Chromatiales bacterium]|nr:PIG-L family deacetylase [Chromatiales bacterium]
MYKLSFIQQGQNAIKSILFLGAHCDDIEIGCGGTLLRLAEDNPQVSILWVVFSSSPAREKEARASAKKFLAKFSNTTIVIKNYRNGFFPYIASEIKEYFEDIKKQLSPDIVFTHYRSDLHQDHRLVSELTWNTFRDHLIFEYEIVKYDGDFGSPNFFVPIPAEICERKINIITDCFKSQQGKQWFDRETFLSILRLRGVECASQSRYAEAFYCRKLVV